MLIVVLQDGLRITYFWIKEQIEKEKSKGIDLSIYGSSKVVGTQAPVQLGSLRAADGKEWNGWSYGCFAVILQKPNFSHYDMGMIWWWEISYGSGVTRQ